MMEQLITIEKARAEHLEEVLGILAQVQLPREGVPEHFGDFLIARSGAGKIIGCIGLERYGDLALLRSVAVLPEYQGQRIGTKLVRGLIKDAEKRGVAEIVLLTTTAKGFFEIEFGFTEARRSRYEKRLAQSQEWNLPRCSSATFMILKRKPGVNTFH